MPAGSLGGEFHASFESLENRRLMASAETLMTWRSHAGGGDFAVDTATDANGNIFTVGTFGGSDSFIRKIGPNGALLWTKRFDEENNLLAVATDATGNVYAAGRVDSGASPDVMLKKLSPNGAILWSRRFELAGDDWAWDVAVDSEGSAYVVGEAKSAPLFDAAVRKVSASGVTLWYREFRTADAGQYVAESVALDGDENVYVGFSSGKRGYVRKFSADAVTLQTIALPGMSEAFVDLDANDNLYVAGVGAQQGTNDVIVRKLASNAAASTLWSRQFGTTGTDTVGGIAVTDDGNVVVSSTSESIPDYRRAHVRVYNTLGQVRWSRQYQDGKFTSAEGVSVDNKGNIYLAMSAYLPSVNQPDRIEYDALVRKIAL